MAKVAYVGARLFALTLNGTKPLPPLAMAEPVSELYDDWQKLCGIYQSNPW